MVNFHPGLLSVGVFCGKSDSDYTFRLFSVTVIYLAIEAVFQRFLYTLKGVVYGSGLCPLFFMPAKNIDKALVRCL